MTTWLMFRDRCDWYWTYALHTTVGKVSLTSLNGNLHYPTDIDRTLNEVAADKILQYRFDYNNRPSIYLILLVLQDTFTVNLCVFHYCRIIGKLNTYL
jgi:tRNA-dihydrouridine synthase